jgi:hypothetical protein
MPAGRATATAKPLAVVASGSAKRIGAHAISGWLRQRKSSALLKDGRIVQGLDLPPGGGVERSSG